MYSAIVRIFYGYCPDIDRAGGFETHEQAAEYVRANRQRRSRYHSDGFVIDPNGIYHNA